MSNVIEFPKVQQETRPEVTIQNADGTEVWTGTVAQLNSGEAPTWAYAP